MVFRRLGLTLTLFIACSAARADATTDFNTLLDEHWEWTLASAPIMASTMGDRRRNQDWGDMSLDAIGERRDEVRAFLRRVYAINRSALSEDDQLNHELFRRHLEDRIDEYRFNAHLLQSLRDSLAQSDRITPADKRNIAT